MLLENIVGKHTQHTTCLKPNFTELSAVGKRLYDCTMKLPTVDSIHVTCHETFLFPYKQFGNDNLLWELKINSVVKSLKYLLVYFIQIQSSHKYSCDELVSHSQNPQSTLSSVEHKLLSLNWIWNYTCFKHNLYWVQVSQEICMKHIYLKYVTALFCK